jgi:predicted transcriptional regulator
MDPRYKTLTTIFTITKDDPQPTTYKCRPRDLILRQFQDWSIIQQHIEQLESEGLVLMRQEDTLVIQITADGIEKIKAGSIATA